MKKAFILGNPRSGTSLLRLMLNAHPEICCPPESGFLQWWYSKYKGWSIEDANSMERINHFVEDVLSSKKIETWNLNKARLGEFLFEEQPANYGELGTCVIKMYGLNHGCNPSVVVDKNNYYIHHLDTLKLIWPDAYFIFIIRDGRDVACSYREIANLKTDSPYKPTLPHDIEAIAREWNDNNLRIQEFLNRLPVHKWLRLRYEDIVIHTEDWLHNLVNFLNIPFSQRMFEYEKFNDEPAATLDWKKKTLSKPDSSNIGKYLTNLSRSEIIAFNSYAIDGLSLGKYK